MICINLIYNSNLASKHPDIDLILGGHDHLVFIKTGKGNLILKSGTDFRQFSFNKVKLYKKSEETSLNSEELINTSKNLFSTKIYKDKCIIEIETEIKEVTSLSEKNENIHKVVEWYNSQLEEKFENQIGYLYERIDARFEIVRSQNTPIANFVSDIVNTYMDSEITIINTGGLRIDSIINEGMLKLGVLKRLLPHNYELVKIKISGENIHKALENAVSKYPSLEGRFPMVSNIVFTFDQNKPILQRINR